MHPTVKPRDKLATDNELVDGEPAGVSLREAEKWLEKWKVSGRAINKAGELVWSYDPTHRDTRVVGGAVWRLMVHDEHVWLCNTNTKEFDQKYGGKDAVPTKVARHIKEGVREVAKSPSTYGAAPRDRNRRSVYTCDP